MTVHIKTADGWKPWLPANAPACNHNQLEGVFKEVSLEDARKETAKHAEHYSNCVNKFINGEYPGNGATRYQAMWDHIRAYRMLGAYGETL